MFKFAIVVFLAILAVAAFQMVSSLGTGYLVLTWVFIGSVVVLRIKKRFR